MTRDEAKAVVVGILTENFSIPKDKISEEASFRKSFGMDSLDIVDFVFFLQKAFGFKAELDEYRSVHTVALLLDFVVARAPAPPAGGASA
jgi:acyl carrier protein